MKVIVNHKDIFEVQSSDIDGLDIVSIGNNTYHLLHKNKSYTIQVLERSDDGKALLLNINGEMLNTSIETEYDTLLKKLGMDQAPNSGSLDLKAPMPGLVLDVQINPGDKITKGDGLLVLEAMKMENVLKASGNGKVKDVKVKSGDSVNKNDILITFE